MISPREWRRVLPLVGLALLVTSAPYLYAFAAQPPEAVFGGLLLNPADGNSYFAKMQQGYRGEWLFTLRYSAEPGAGAFLFTFYIFLGHLARWLGLTIPFTFHAARVAGGAALLVTAYAFAARFADRPRWRLALWLLIALGSGFGWLATLGGGFTSDLWVAEAIPFLSLYANPHFPLAQAAQLWILLAALPLPGARQASRSPARPYLTVLAATTALGLLLPFALLTTGIILTGWTLSRPTLHVPRPTPLLIFTAAALPWLLNAYLAARNNPLLAAWSAQNQTPSPPVWDYLIACGPPLLLALPGALQALRRREPGGRFLVLWAALNGLALYAPFSLQRRLILGLYFPLAALAIGGLRLAAGRLRLAATVILCLGLPTNLLVLLAGLHGVRAADPALYLTSGEAAAMQWLAAHTPPEAVILAAPETGLFIPAWTGRRVVYGHPFETVDAATKERAVLDFFGPQETQPAAEALIRSQRVDYLFVGPRELALGGLLPVSGLRVVYRGGGVTIYALPDQVAKNSPARA